MLAVSGGFGGVLGAKVVNEYMDGRCGSGSTIVNNVFGQIDVENSGGDGKEEEVEDDRICLTLLYRPGHYDILY